MRRRSATAGSAPAISVMSTRKASSTSPAAPPTCTSPAAPTSIRAKWRKKSSPIRDRRGRRARRARHVLGRGGRRGLRRAGRGKARERGGAGGIPRAKGAALQDAKTLLLLGGAAEIRLWQGAEAH